MTLKSDIYSSPVCKEEEKRGGECVRRGEWCRAVVIKLYTPCITSENIRLSKYHHYDPCQNTVVELGNPIQRNVVQTGVKVIPKRNCIYC